MIKLPLTSSITLPVVIKFVVLLSVLVFKTPVALFNAVMSASLSVIKPETVFTSVIRVCPVVIRLLVRLVISESLDVICVWRVCPVVIKLPLIVSTTNPVEIRLEETVFIFVVRV